MKTFWYERANFAYTKSVYIAMCRSFTTTNLQILKPKRLGSFFQKYVIMKYPSRQNNQFAVGRV